MTPVQQALKFRPTFSLCKLFFIFLLFLPRFIQDNDLTLTMLVNSCNKTIRTPSVSGNTCIKFHPPPPKLLYNCRSISNYQERERLDSCNMFYDSPNMAIEPGFPSPVPPTPQQFNCCWLHIDGCWAQFGGLNWSPSLYTFSFHKLWMCKHHLCHIHFACCILPLCSLC